MRILFYLFFILLLAIGLGFLIHQDPGYVVVAYRHWTMATSFWVASAAILAAFFVFYCFIRLVKNIAAIPRFISRRRQFSRAQRYQKYMTQGIMALSIGDFKKAESTFLKVIANNNAYANYLLAAQAAQGQSAWERRDQYLETARLNAGKDTFAVSLVQGIYEMQSGQWDNALITLKPLYKEEPKNVFLLKALKTIYFKSRDFPSLHLILPQLKKQKLISKEELQQIMLAHG